MPAGMMNEVTEAPKKERPVRWAVGLFGVAVLALAGSGCSRSGMNAASALSIDPVTTATIQPLAADADILADSAVAGDAVAALSPQDFGDPLPWANPDTGAAGVITALNEAAGERGPCRSFTTTRNGFDGVAQFDGRICQTPDGWRLVRFDRQTR